MRSILTRLRAKRRNTSYDPEGVLGKMELGLWFCSEEALHTGERKTSRFCFKKTKDRTSSTKDEFVLMDVKQVRRRQVFPDEERAEQVVGFLNCHMIAKYAVKWARGQRYVLPGFYFFPFL